MKHPSLYLDWYIRVPKIKYDFRSSGIAYFKYSTDLGEVDLNLNYAHGNPEALRVLACRYETQPENVFISSEGASGLNTRIIRYLAERNPKKNEAIVEYPTYEPLLRQVQEHFKHTKRLERKEKDGYRLDADRLRRVVSERTGLLAVTNPHAPTGAISDRGELKEVMAVAQEYGFYVLCDEIYSEFDRSIVPTIFSVDHDYGVVTTSFTKAYGLGGLKLGVALAGKRLVDELYTDVLNTVGNSPNIIQLLGASLLTKGKEKLERHQQRWVRLRKQIEEWMREKDLEYVPNKVGVTYWVKTPIQDTYKWVNEQTIRLYNLAPVPGTFFMFESGYELAKSKMIRLGLGGLNPKEATLTEAFGVFERALKTGKFLR